MKKSVQVISTIIVLCVAFAALFTLVGCAKQDEYSWTVRGDDGDIRAYYSDNGKYGFVLNIEGKGKLPDYAAYKDAPWYVKNGRITEIRISDGITAIGANTFSGVRTDMVIVPKTVKTIGANAFGEDVTLCVYGEVSVAGANKVLLYSEKAPNVDGVYWHLRDGKPVVWQTIKVLFIGNSFTFYSDIPSLFAKIAIGAGQSVDVDSVTQGAWTLTKFADEKDEKGKEVDDKLRANQYDIIVLQDQSTRPLDNNSGFVSGVKAMRDKIKATQKNCKIYLYSTWGYEEAAKTAKTTIVGLEAQIRKAYEDVASQIAAAGVCQVGQAFSKVYTEHADTIDLYYSDDKHPSYAGSYLSACVHVATLLGIDPRTSTFNDGPVYSEKYTEADYKKFNESMATILKQAAYDVVFN